MVNFEAIKHGVKITDVCARYGIQLRFRGEWASAKCPLPTHKEGDKDKTFQVNVMGNYWKCWSQTCNEKAGKKGGDCINFVAVMEECSQLDSAKKLAAWFHLDKEKPAPHIEKRAPEKVPKSNPQRDSLDITSQSDSVKGYMADVDAWFNSSSRATSRAFSRRFQFPSIKFPKRRVFESLSSCTNSLRCSWVKGFDSLFIFLLLFGLFPASATMMSRMSLRTRWLIVIIMNKIMRGISAAVTVNGGRTICFLIGFDFFRHTVNMQTEYRIRSNLEMSTVLSLNVIIFRL